MGDTSAIVDDMIRLAFSEEPGAVKPVADKDLAPLFEQKDPEFKLKVYKKTLEEITRKLEEEYDDYQSIPPDSLEAMKRALIDTRKGFYAMRATRIPQDINGKIDGVLPNLKEAISFITHATTLLVEEGEGRNNKYYNAISDCYERLFQIKQLLKS